MSQYSSPSSSFVDRGIHADPIVSTNPLGVGPPLCYPTACTCFPLKPPIAGKKSFLRSLICWQAKVMAEVSVLPLAWSIGPGEGQDAWVEGDGVLVSTSQGQAVLPDTASWAYWFGWIFMFFYVSQVTFIQQHYLYIWKGWSALGSEWEGTCSILASRHNLLCIPRCWSPGHCSAQGEQRSLSQSSKTQATSCLLHPAGSGSCWAWKEHADQQNTLHYFTQGKLNLWL